MENVQHYIIKPVAPFYSFLLDFKITTHTKPTQNPHATHTQSTQNPCNTYTKPTQKPTQKPIHNPHATHMQPTQNPHNTYTKHTQPTRNLHKNPYATHTQPTHLTLHPHNPSPLPALEENVLT